MAARRFPPVVQYPEKQRDAPLLSALCSWPVIVWVPECLQASKKPFCAMPGCSCTPRLKEYKQRVVEEVDTKCHLLYTKYQCTGESTGCFSTVTPAYLQSKRESMVDAKMLLLLQNEIGQSVGRRLTRSENNDETRELLEFVKPTVSAAENGSECFVISDNANAVRNMDPFHVVQRFTEKVKEKTAKKQLAKRLHDAMYDVDGQLRLPAEMAARVRDAVASANTYEEGGGKSVRVLSTSQLEGFHSALKKLLARSVSAEIGLRILDIFILFESARVDTSALELSLHHSKQHSTNIKELLSKQAVFAATSRLPKAAFFNSLCLSEIDYEAAAGFSSQEFALLRQLRNEQAKAGRTWGECALVTTIMYNVVVSSNTNKLLNLRRRSYATLASKIDTIAKHETDKSSPPLADVRGLFTFSYSEPRDDKMTGNEQAFQVDLFTALRQTSGIRNKRQVFLRVYDFASCICSGIFPKSPPNLLARWESLKRGSNRGASLKIKLKIPPGMLLKAPEQPLTRADSDDSSVEEQCSEQKLNTTATAENPVPALPSRKRKETSCSSCRRKKKRSSCIDALHDAFALSWMRESWVHLCFDTVGAMAGARVSLEYAALVAMKR
ncbi:hypothetical protein PHYSODRAFT_348643 [Phytophthora sojae]|uniref:Uncharacterized protein n=1 Tax=Phytophthora sojae (strain P6497) TaxID=1094619 RepID=G5AH83_PHYSP|nr:hypothetical protein PHYSODRAFT_348643 [Phytophthora sojae]EGZ05062.1 hypothetical protein PHYSODRAFT_348643 [Phytophthora sojae]|eukprot:XP_009539434.1 hypothetical protein PHYSODRAFT_348643 [Phytophthora sojae]